MAKHIHRCDWISIDLDHCDLKELCAQIIKCPFLLRYEITACIYIKTEISETAFKIQTFMHNKDRKGPLRVYGDRKNFILWQSS